MYKTPTLVQKYEPPVLLDLNAFSSVMGDCATSGGSCKAELW